MINNFVVIWEMVFQVWDIMKWRDDLVIFDLFIGLYKFIFVCFECNKISIMFDFFINLIFFFFMVNLWFREIRFYLLNDVFVNIVVDIDKNSSIKGLKQFILQCVGVFVDCFMVFEEFLGKFFKYYDDMVIVFDDIFSNDIVVVYEFEVFFLNLVLIKDLKK